MFFWKNYELLGAPEQSNFCGAVCWGYNGSLASKLYTWSINITKGGLDEDCLVLPKARWLTDSRPGAWFQEELLELLVWGTNFVCWWNEHTNPVSQSSHFYFSSWPCEVAWEFWIVHQLQKVSCTPKSSSFLSNSDPLKQLFCLGKSVFLPYSWLLLNE